MSLPWMPPDWVLLVTAAVTLLYVYLTWTFNHWKKHGVPYEEPKLIYGNYKDFVFLKKALGETIRDIYRNHTAHRYVGVFRFSEPSLLVRDPQLIKAIMVKDFQNFQKNGLIADEELDPLMSRNPFFVTGEKWKKVRSQLTPAFTSGKLKTLFPLMEEVCSELGQYVEDNQPGNRPDGFEVKDLAEKYTADVVATCAFGIRGNSFKDPNAELRRMGKTVLQPSGVLATIRFATSFLFPNVARVLRFRIMSIEVSNFFRNIVSEIVGYREKNKVERNDFLQLLMQLKDKAPVSGYTDEDVTAHAVTFFTDGFETSSVLIGFMLYDLAMNPDVQEKLRQEVDEVLKKNGGKIDHEAISQMKYLENVMFESLRSHPPVLHLEKMCTSPYKLPKPSGGTFTVQPGTCILIPICAIHHDPQYFPEPDKFDPERFSEESRQPFNDGIFMPFGYGPRLCLGMRFAQAQVKVCVTYLVHNFEIKKTHKTPDPVVLDPSSFLGVAKGGLWLDFVKRKK